MVTTLDNARSFLHVRALGVAVHPERRDDWEEISDLDDEELARVERRRELDERPRHRRKNANGHSLKRFRRRANS